MCLGIRVGLLLLIEVSIDVYVFLSLSDVFCMLVGLFSDDRRKGEWSSSVY